MSDLSDPKEVGSPKEALITLQLAQARRKVRSAATLGELKAAIDLIFEALIGETEMRDDAR